MSSQPIPVTILSGFLGAGKTTLLNRILNGQHDLRIAVLVNDFGAINIDADLVVGVEDDMISLANGCVCCQIRDDLVESVEALLSRPEPVEYVVLEASGVADPGGISITFMDQGLRDRIRLDSVTCVVDADQILGDQDHPAVEMLKLRQIGFADMVVLNKADLAGPAGVRDVRNWIDGHFNRLRVVETSFCDVPMEILLSVGRFDPAQLDDKVTTVQQPAEDHGRAFSTWSYTTDEPFALEALREMVKHRLPGSVYRCKGVIHVAEQPARRVILQCVGRRTDVTPADLWGNRRPCTQIVAIGIPGEMDANQLDALFNRCLAGRQGPPDATGPGLQTVRI